MKHSEEKIRNRIQFLKDMIAQFENELNTLDWVLSLMEEDEAKEPSETNEVEEADNLILDDDNDAIGQLAVADLFEDDIIDDVSYWDDDLSFEADEEEEKTIETVKEVAEDIEDDYFDDFTDDFNDAGDISKKLVKKEFNILIDLISENDEILNTYSKSSDLKHLLMDLAELEIPEDTHYVIDNEDEIVDGEVMERIYRVIDKYAHSSITLSRGYGEDYKLYDFCRYIKIYKGGLDLFIKLYFEEF